TTSTRPQPSIISLHDTPPISSKIKVDLNKEEIQKYIKEQLEDQLWQEYLFVDINKLVQLTSCSKRWLEEELLGDPRVRLCERRKNRKRLWLYPDVIEAIKEIVEEW